MAPHQSRSSHSKIGCCTGPLDRRNFLKVGIVSGLGLTLGDYFQLQAAQADEQAPKKAAAAESVIFIFMAGGMSHMDTFDPKPYMPIEYRGELGTVKTKNQDVFSGQLQRLAKISDKFSVIRSMTHGEAAHERGTHNMLTGYRPSAAVQYPSYGSVVAHEFGPRNDLPPYITIPNSGDKYFGTGYLSSAYGPFSVGGEPSAADFKVRDLNLSAGITPERMEKRKNLLADVDHHFSELESSDLLSAMDSYYQRAYSLISSQKAREAFDMTGEPDAIKDEYGRTPFGQRLLLSRRLVEAGARFVTVIDGGWDNHEKIRDAMRGKLPPVDQGIATLLTDLDRRGLLEKTMVVVSTEFGRTVKINTDGGRDHWPKAFSVMLAGGGITGGQIYGKTDARGAEPAEDPVTPEDLASTIYTQLGINPGHELMSPGDRPIEIVKDGSPLYNLIT
ncbi:MAG: sulfatase [Candidatus Hydrogenedentota bacterium]|nr:MAG: sulfatase [Candidatus Hydrogenedentota bacterium]